MNQGVRQNIKQSCRRTSNLTAVQARLQIQRIPSKPTILSFLFDAFSLSLFSKRTGYTLLAILLISELITIVGAIFVLTSVKSILYCFEEDLQRQTIFQSLKSIDNNIK